VLEAPSRPGERLVDPDAPAPRSPDAPRSGAGALPGGDEEVRLTYRELTALIADAVTQLR
jgi:hypothetical protein